MAAAEWSHEGETGPGFWGDLSPEFAACRNGTQQSPVDIAGAVDAALDDVAIHWKPAEWKVINNGHTIQLEAPDAGHVSIAGRDYRLLQFIFMRPPNTRSTAGAARWRCISCIRPMMAPWG